MGDYYFNTESLLEINNELQSIRENPDLSDEQKIDMVADLMEGLPAERKREYMEYINYVRNTKTRREDKFVGSPEYKNWFALVEFENLQFHYASMFAMIGSIMYQQERLQDYQCSDEARTAIQDYLKFTYGNYSNKYIGTIYDKYYKNNKAKFADYIPDINPDILGDCMPTPEQVKNFTDYCQNKLEEIRATTTALTGYRPSQEATIRVHGVFPDMGEKMIKYRDTHFLEYDRHANLFPIEIGKIRLLDPFRDYRTSINLFNPDDKDVEILHANRVTMNASQYRKFNERLSKLDKKLDDNTLSDLKQYRKQLRDLNDIQPEDRTPDHATKIEFVKKNIKEIQEIAAKDGEVVTSVIKFDKANKKITTKDVIAKVEGELDLF